MDAQRIMDSFSSSRRSTRLQYHLTLGRLIDKLKDLPKNAEVKFSSGGYVGREMSYRGYYSDLSFDVGEKPKTIESLFKQAKNALGNDYQGYKGGDYTMEEDTPLWKAEYGDCGEAIIDMIFQDNELILICKNVDE